MPTAAKTKPAAPAKKPPVKATPAKPPAKGAATKVAEAAKDTGRKVVHPIYAVNVHTARTDAEHYLPPLTAADARRLLGWKTEEVLRQEKLEEHPEYKDVTKVKLVDDKTGKKLIPLLTLPAGLGGQKVFCLQNAINRPFKPGHAAKLAQDMLNREWRLNMENIVVADTGLIHSGQHRLVGLVLAALRWVSEAEKFAWAEKWPTEPALECTVAFGVEDTQAVRATYDNTMPRTLADTLFTSEVFQSKSGADRQLMCRMLDRAVDVLWRRTGAGEKGGGNRSPLQTHAASQDFLERHRKLLKCVEHLFSENAERAISNLDLSPGWAAAMMYLFGCCGSEPNEYRAKGRDEKALDWRHWKNAGDFWATLAGVSDKSPVRKALADLRSYGYAATSPLTVCQSSLICRAWELYRANPDEGSRNWTATSLALDWTKDDVGQPALPRELVTLVPAGGIDVTGTDEAEDEEQEAPAETKAEKKARLAAEAKAAVEASQGNAEPAGRLKELADLKTRYPGKVLLFKLTGRTGHVSAYAEDAAIVAKAVGAKEKPKKCDDGVVEYVFAAPILNEVAGRLAAKGTAVGVAEINGGQVVVTDWVPPADGDGDGDGSVDEPAPALEANGDATAHAPTIPTALPRKALPKPLNRR